ncbi:hypothetical protein HII31_04415 [Pseudocercospora fuligena]|uniref:Uncharacterized protein n=1 Tax=Pseudocercospora fuligena TaxID=685502 RepID=A0A8H6RN51_9PEZI|nr:hypothetical protein HII31_04415 [Pseudocercospora fuligena]
MSSYNFKPTMHSRRDSDTPDPEALFVSDNRREVDREVEYSGPEDDENGLEQDDSDGDPFASSAHLGIQGTTGGTAADHDGLQFHTVAQGAGRRPVPIPRFASPEPESEIKVKAKDKKQSEFMVPDPASVRKPIRALAAKPANAFRREEQRRWRWDRFGHRIGDFQKQTEKSRMWYQHQQAQKKVWDLERARLNALVPKLKAEIAKAEQDFVNMAAAQGQLEEDHGDEIENGRINHEKLEMWSGFLHMENDEYPYELEGYEEGDAEEELEAFQRDAAKEGNEDLLDEVEDVEGQAENVEDEAENMMEE